MMMRRRQHGFSLIEILISAALVAIAAMAGVAYVTRGSQHATWAKDKVFARQKALSVLAELRSYVEGGEGEVAADLDGFDDGLSVNPTLSIAPDPNDPGAYIAPDAPLSDNAWEYNDWRWYRRITVRRFPGISTRDLRICTVRMFRMRPGDSFPGEQMAEVSSVIRTIGDAYPTTQVYDVYLLALENVPGWWVYMDAIQPFIEATLTDLESRNPGLKFRAHWITKLGFGRDEEYAPYTNETRDSRADTPWTYIYPGTMPAGENAQRYYVANRFGARMNVDGAPEPSFTNERSLSEGFTDDNGNGRRDPGETFTDSNSNGQYDLGNPVPYALADMHNHCMRHPEAAARFDARVDAGLESDDTPTWRLLLDRMIAEPNRYHNAILINLHGELLPMPPMRNYSDAAKKPDAHPGWRAVTHPERLAPRRVAGNDSLSNDTRLRVYAYKATFPTGHQPLMTQAEPFIDSDRDGVLDPTESYSDWNNNGLHDAEGVPITISIPGGDLSNAVNALSNASLVIRRLAGGIDADGSGSPDSYVSWTNASTYPESFNDGNNDGRRQVVEPFFDQNGNGSYDSGEPWTELDGDGVRSSTTETLSDGNANGVWDPDKAEEPFTDANGNGDWDAEEPYLDVDGDGAWTAPTSPVTPWVAWDPAQYASSGSLYLSSYVASYGEPFRDIDGDNSWDKAEAFTDYDGDGIRDGGWKRGEMWYRIRYESSTNETILELYGTPLEAPSIGNRGLHSHWRLYDLDYIPCPTPDSTSSSDTARYRRDLFWSGDVPKNTARWTIDLSSRSIRNNLDLTPGSNDGDQADRILRFETRIGKDVSTGTMWPTRNQPSNLSRTYAYFYANSDDVPYSERYQFMGDPRHCPYSDLDRYGSTAANGYNWYFDNFRTNGDYRYAWNAFDTARLRDVWMGARGSGHDVPRLMGMLRTALAETEAVYTTLTGFSYYYLSLGGDIGYDSANGFPSSIPVDGKPFGLTGDLFESTITTHGTSSVRGSRKYVRSNNGTTGGMRSGGYWWSKPWIGELYEDSVYTSQWVPYGNLRADTGVTAGEYRLIRRGDITGNQEPRGTNLKNAYARLSDEGCTSLFNVGSSSSTFHHQYQNGQTGTLVDDGPQLAANYNFPLPTTTRISRPFGIAVSWSGGVGPEFGYTDSYPRFAAQLVTRYYNHQNGQYGSALVRLQTPGSSPRGAYIIVNGIDRTIESGSAFIARYSLLSLIHSYFAAGVPGGANRIRQLPRLQIQHPTLITELEDPATIPVRWTTEWKRWDGQKYTDAYANNFSESESDLVYVPMYSTDGGKTWRHMLDDTPAELGVMPWRDGVGPDPEKTLQDQSSSGEEVWTWNTPKSKFPEGSYLIRIEGYRSNESLHYVQHQEKIYVNR